MQVTISKLTMAAMTVVTMPMTNAEDIETYHGLSHVSVDVGDDFSVGKWSNWQGSYWVLEHRTGIIQYSSSLVEVKEWIKLCRDALAEEIAGRLNMQVTGLDYAVSLVEHADYYETTYGAQVARFMDFATAYKDFQQSVSHALALKGTK